MPVWVVRLAEEPMQCCTTQLPCQQCRTPWYWEEGPLRGLSGGPVSMCANAVTWTVEAEVTLSSATSLTWSVNSKVPIVIVVFHVILSASAAAASSNCPDCRCQPKCLRTSLKLCFLHVITTWTCPKLCLLHATIWRTCNMCVRMFAELIAITGKPGTLAG